VLARAEARAASCRLSPFGHAAAWRFFDRKAWAVAARTPATRAFAVARHLRRVEARLLPQKAGDCPMTQFRLLSTSAIGSAAFIGLATASTTPAFAQDARPDCTAEQQAAGDCVPAVGSSGEPQAQEQVITVTGSRIRRPGNFEALEPTVTVDAQYIEDRNLTNVADALNELPGFRGSVTPAGAQGSFGQGVNFVNNFGLGSNRTLTLVNGRRFVSSNVPTLFNQGSQGTQVDLNVIPSILVDHIDTVSVGGAPVYGSDAISGTVNIVLRTNYEGLQVSALSGITEEGDNFRYNLSGVGGMNFAGGRGNISASLSYDNERGVLFNQRGFLVDNLGNVTNPSSAAAAGLGRAPGITVLNDGRVNTAIGFNDSDTDGFPGTVLARDVTIPFLTYGGLITAANAAGAGAVRNFQFDPNGNLVPFARGIPFPGINASGGDGFRFNDFSQITSNLERTIGNLFVNYEFSPALRFFAEGTYFHSRGDELVQQPTFNSNLFGGTSGPLTFDLSYPFLTQQARDTLAANGVTIFQVSRASTDLADVTGFSKNNLYRAVIGLRGDFQIWGRDFNYEVSGNYGRTEITDVGQDLNAQHFINAVNVTEVNGQIVCTTTPSVQAAPGGTPIADPACVPLNLLGGQRASQAARDYVIQTSITRSRLVQKVFNANIGGSFFDVWGGPVSFNAGYEHREESGAFVPDEFQQQGLGRSVAIAPVSGSYNVDELFGEALIPLVEPANHVPAIDKLELFARGRYVDNTVNGGFFSWTLGGSWAPIRDIEFRGNFTKSFRAPAITELFLPVSNAFNTVPDLCSPAAQTQGPDPETRQRNCVAFLAAFPNATPLFAASATVPVQSGGNPALQNETANSYTFGVIARPRFIPGLTFSADYVRIRIDDPIANLTIAQIASACFDNPNFNTADPANGNAFCSLIRRNPAGTIGLLPDGTQGDIGGQVIVDPANPAVSSGFVNGNRIDFSGIQGSVYYETSLSGIGVPGRVSAQSDWLYVRRRLIDNTGVAPQRSDGILGDPKWSGQLNLRYFDRDFGILGSINYVGRQLFARTPRADTSPSDIREFDHLRAYATVNTSVYFNINERMRLTLSVTNLFNHQGQDYLGVLIPASYTDLLGRRYAASVRMRF
jgi:outer membrane receptor protein involved in Fe transport